MCSSSVGGCSIVSNDESYIVVTIVVVVVGGVANCFMLGFALLELYSTAPFKVEARWRGECPNVQYCM